jgi:hypothetical protein
MSLTEKKNRLPILPDNAIIFILCNASLSQKNTNLLFLIGMVFAYHPRPIIFIERISFFYAKNAAANLLPVGLQVCDCLGDRHLNVCPRNGFFYFATRPDEVRKP